MIQVRVHTKSLLRVQVLVAHHGQEGCDIRQQTPAVGAHLARKETPNFPPTSKQSIVNSYLVPEVGQLGGCNLYLLPLRGWLKLGSKFSEELLWPV